MDDGWARVRPSVGRSGPGAGPVQTPDPIGPFPCSVLLARNGRRHETRNSPGFCSFSTLPPPTLFLLGAFAFLPSCRLRVVPSGGGGGGPGRRGSRRRRVQADSSAAAGAGCGGAVQRLFRACRHVFRGPGTVPRPDEVRLLRDMLDRMRPEDVGLSPDLRFFRTRDATQGTPTITHTTIYKCPNFSMVILFLPRNAVIPLHNHPGMTVFSKLLLGTMHIKSYDWVDPEPDLSASTSSSSSSSSSDGQLRLAKLVVDDVFRAPCDTSVLYPTTGGNMHRFTALAPCAILDILGPPYSIEEDRDCTYYTDIPYTHHPTVVDDTGDDPYAVALEEQGQGSLAWLKEIDMPRELKMCSVPYGGPPISEK